MTKDEILAYLNKKKQLTADAQDARHEIYVARQQLAATKHFFKKWMILTPILWLIVLIVFGAFLGSSTVDRYVPSIFTFACIAFIAYLIYRRIVGGVAANKAIAAGENHLRSAEQNPDYIRGMQDFPQEFYSYWTIDRLMHLVQENRATTLQEAFNVAENQDFQHDQLSLQQQNLAVSESTNKMATVSAVANVFTAFNTRK